MRRLLVATLTAGCLLVEGAAVSQAAPVTSGIAQQAAAAPTSATSAPASTNTSGARTVALDAPAAQNAAAHPERRRVRTKKRRSGIGRFFGALAFLFIGLPMLIVLGLVLFFMLRRSRKQRERQMMQQGAPGQWNDPAQQYRSGQNGPDHF